MDINSIASVSAALSQAKTGDAVALAVMRKSNEIQEQSARELLKALPEPNTNSPPNLGNAVNTFA